MASTSRGEQPVWSLDRLRREVASGASLWVTPSVAAEVVRELRLPVVTTPEEATGLLVVCGGGTMIDRAKKVRGEREGTLGLVAIPSVWGSGAEATPIVTERRDGRVVPFVDERFLPDARVEWPSLGRSVPPALARDACGDVWAHAWEGFLSPLASDALRAEGAALINTLLELPLEFHEGWFAASAHAAALQARSSVGLVHGVAHVLEPLSGLGHAALCAVTLLPAARLALSSPTVPALLEAHGVPASRALERFTQLHDAATWARLVPVLRTAWRDVLRHPFTRTSAFVVRPGHLDALTGGA